MNTPSLNYSIYICPTIYYVLAMASVALRGTYIVTLAEHARSCCTLLICTSYYVAIIYSYVYILIKFSVPVAS